ncbi:peptide chain release factor N(5)-glutamine methyltransferase [Silvibacterium dinghuense]|uniref:Release factor glutamine methyltransferase n=1 Tax=Silvibacterium dinghuense TaxID=1560006 RepID=A0A4Q1SJ90_9BACT|nr:peptide chain release factor N(5)-glutamine methyltransferase [Silvibacterium dinghuense]RXS97704.1 peptide chain release factor N(5)-glutamine methyltransferase [Silvibacterium dinghuense]
MENSATVRNLLKQAAEQLRPAPTAARDAELLLLHTLKKDRVWLLMHPDAGISAEAQAAFFEKIARRAKLEPIQYITGEQEFYGFTFRVTPATLIPRPETEHLVEAALEHGSRDSSARILDIGTGSGAIAIVLAHLLPQAEVTAVDLSPAALAIAQENAARYGVEQRIRFLESDLLTAVAGEQFDMIVSNPPYVPSTDILEPQVRDYEPASALYAGEDGLDIYRRLIPQAHAALKPGGWLLMEIGYGQREVLTTLLSGWEEIGFVDDLQGIPRVAMARRG